MPMPPPTAAHRKVASANSYYIFPAYVGMLQHLLFDPGSNQHGWGTVVLFSRDHLHTRYRVFEGFLCWMWLGEREGGGYDPILQGREGLRWLYPGELCKKK